ncbi:triple tyrosine motif-containing protein [Pseudoduganella sp.]|uniref:sensor histidine kinase n=1 Tax=Pseudoduganella sp. TaxID=1880898 RepID=UPI0035AF21AA
MSIQRWPLLLLHWLLALAVHAAPADAGRAASLAAPQPDGQSFERRRWTQVDGAPQMGNGLAQTADGMLWIGSALGLYSFDGVRFRKVQQVYGQPLQSSNISFIYKFDDALAVGYYFGGLSIFTPRGATHHRAGRGFPRGSMQGFTASKDGKQYAITTTGLFMQQGGQWVAQGEDSLPGGGSWVAHDRAGRLWVRVDRDYYVRPLGSTRFVRLPVEQDVRTAWTMDGLFVLPRGGNVRPLDVAPLPPDLPARQFVLPDQFRSPPLPGPHGTLWSTRSDGLVRLAPGADGKLQVAELFASSEARDAMINRMTIDREGNLWILNPGGVERLRRHRVQRLPGAANAFFWLGQRGFGDELWLGANGLPLTRVKADGSRQETPVSMANVLLRLTDDHVWVGAAKALWEFHGDRQQQWDLPPGLGKAAEVQALARERGGRLLVSLTRNGLWHFDQGKWQRDPRLAGVDEAIPTTMLTDSQGITWLGLTNNRLLWLENGTLQTLPASAGLQVGNVLTLADIGGKLLVGGDLGAAWLENGTAHPLRLRNVENFQRITGMVTDRQGSLWLHSNDGLHRVSAEALAGFWRAPAHALQAELFNFEDGIHGMAAQSRPLPSLSLAHDGRLYYATMTETGWLDPSAIARNRRAPTVLLQSLRSGEREYAAQDGLVLPQQTSAVELAFTATALSIPERVRLKFRLDGVDRDWREAGPERRAQYTNLAPGEYRFRVIAANEDGVWNTEGAQFSFRIEPALWQTTGFRLACALAALLAALQLYRWRVAVIQRRAEQHAALRLEATLQERSRIARSLHDNLLQAVQALLLRFHLVEQKLVAQPELRHMVGSALDYAETLVASTRDEVMELRRAPGADALFESLRQAAEQALPGAGQRLSFTVSGRPRHLALEAGAELGCVLREAVWNSVRHAGARQIAVRLEYGAEALLAQACDDGVGLDPAIAEHGRDGHWGLAGMRERIGRLGGRIAIAAGAQGGTEVRLAIPAQQAYA